MLEEPVNADELSNEIHALATAVFSGEFTPEQKDRLEQLVSNDERTCDLYGKCIIDSVGIRTHFADSIFDGMAISHDISRKQAEERRSPLGSFQGKAMRSVWGFVSDNTPLRSILHLKTIPYVITGCVIFAKL
jgi:hypothetical protein